MNIILIHFGQSQAYVLLPLCSLRVLAAFLKSSCQHTTTQGNSLVPGSAYSFATGNKKLCLSYSSALLYVILYIFIVSINRFFPSRTVIVCGTSIQYCSMFLITPLSLCWTVSVSMIYF